MKTRGCNAWILTACLAAQLAATGVLAGASPASAQPIDLQPIGLDVTVTPRRLVFGEGSRGAEVILINRGSSRMTYRIGWVQKRMTAAGELIDVPADSPGEAPLGDLIRFAPRQVVLEPNDRQIVRLFLRKPAGLPPGEYRSHLLLQAVPPPEQAADAEQLDGKAFTTNLGLLFGFAIPVIVRHGELDARVRLDGLAYEPAGPDGQPAALSLTLHREGDRSLYGDLTATLQPAGGGEEIVVGKALGLAVYTPLADRQARLELQLPVHAPLAGGRLRLTWSPRVEDDGGGAEQPLATAEILLPLL
jgi:P pilus assembly chaperone PapD